MKRSEHLEKERESLQLKHQYSDWCKRLNNLYLSKSQYTTCFRDRLYEREPNIRKKELEYLSIIMSKPVIYEDYTRWRLVCE